MISRNQFVGLMVVLFSLLFLVLGVRVCHDSGATSSSAVCQEACYPNPVDRVSGRQCFCQATITIKEIPNEEVPRSR
jgi:hypothetical protein